MQKRWNENCPKCGSELGMPGFNERFCQKCMIAELDDPQGSGGIWVPILTCIECRQPLLNNGRFDSFYDPNLSSSSISSRDRSSTQI